VGVFPSGLDLLWQFVLVPEEESEKNPVLDLENVRWIINCPRFVVRISGARCLKFKQILLAAANRPFSLSRQSQ
jgi:hypothetical protein